MSIKTFMTLEDDKRQKVTWCWDPDSNIMWDPITTNELYPLDVSHILYESEKYDIQIEIRGHSEWSVVYVPVTCCAKHIEYNGAYGFLSGIGSDTKGYFGGRWGSLCHFIWYFNESSFRFEVRNLYENPAPCLIEGTPINMADGTSKPIELVRSGDIVLSYDPNTETQVPAVVLDAYPTGAERKYTVYNFSNGKHLTIFGLHGYYDKISGTTQDIRDINRDKRLIDIDGNVIQWAGSRDRYFAGQKKIRYNILTSNNLYYANGILLGSRPYNKLQYYLDRGIMLPEDIKSVWQQDCDDHNAYDDVISDASFYAEVAEDYQELAKAKNIIRVNKKRLERTDYQNAKQVEGLLTDEEWSKSKDKRSRYRKEINDNESVYKERLSHVDEVIARYRGDMTAKSIFEACCERDNAIFEIVKSYFSKSEG